MSINEQRILLKKELSERIGFVISDCKSFIYLKFNQPNIYAKETFGGGNILMAMGLMSCFQYLGSIYLLQTTGKIPINAHTKRPIEAEIFYEFLQEFHRISLKTGLEGLHKQQITKLWKMWRHKLFHVLRPIGTAKSADHKRFPKYKYKYLKYLKELNQDREGKIYYMFRKQDENPEIYDMFVDSIVAKMPVILTWVISEIDNPNNQMRISTTFAWINEQIDS